MRVNSLITKTRKKNGMLSKDFADKVGVSISLVSNWEKGQTVNPKYAQKISKALGLDYKKVKNAFVGDYKGALEIN